MRLVNIELPVYTSHSQFQTEVNQIEEHREDKVECHKGTGSQSRNIA